jgi:hypothetical protein
MFFCCECCVLAGRGLCDKLITHPEEFFRLWCVVVCVCDLENLKNEEAMTCVGSQRHSKKKFSHLGHCRLSGILPPSFFGKNFFPFSFHTS